MVQLGLVVAQYDKHGEVIGEMERGAREAAAAHEADIVDTVAVPGSYDTPLAADRLARREDVDAVAVLGTIITGDTAHDRVIADAAASGLTDVSLDRDTPVTLGITGPDMTAAEARDRVDYGRRAVESAIRLVEDSTHA